MTADDIIAKLDLIPLPEEGGFYRETHRSNILIPKNSMEGISSDRSTSTLIYYLVTPEEFSGLHRVKTADEIFHFYLGDPVEMLQITESGEAKKVVMGQNIPEQQLQTVVEKSVWQGTRLVEGGEWALLGCSVAPGFEFDDFEIRTQKEFFEMFPQHKEKLKAYTRP